MSKLWIEETEHLVRQIEQESKALAEEYNRLGRELTVKNEELTHWRAVIQSYEKRQELAVPQPSLFLQESGAYKNLSHSAIALLVRDQNNGMIPMKQVTKVFRSKVANPANAASAAYTTLKRFMKQGKVTKVRPGLYRWVNGVKEHPTGTTVP